MSLALSCALADTLATRGIHARRVLTMVAGTLSEMEGVRVDITPLSDQLARSHPNTLWLSDLEEPEEETPAADPSEEDLTRRVATDMEREGRTAMTRDEEAILDRTTLRENSLDRADHAAHAATSEAYLAAVWGPPATDTGGSTHPTASSSSSGSTGHAGCSAYTTPLYRSRPWRSHSQAIQPQVRDSILAV